MSTTPACAPMERVGIADLHLAARARWGDAVARAILLVAALSVFAILGFILWVLLSNTGRFLAEVPLREFLTGKEWLSEGRPTDRYGVLPLVAGTTVITLGAAVIGLPLGLACAIYLAEYASPRARGVLKPALEVLAGVPSIVFGFFALHVISPQVQDFTARDGTLRTLPGLGDWGPWHALLDRTIGDGAGVFNALSALIVVGVMVLPIVASLSEDALRAVPRHLREASYAVGATKWETTKKVVMPAALSGIAAAFVLGIARAVGETMAVAMAAGTQATWTWNPIESMRTMTAFIVQRTLGDTPRGGPAYHSLFAVGALLFAITLVMNLVARRLVRRFREQEGGNL